MDKNKILNLIGTGTAAAALLVIAMLFSNGGFSNLMASAANDVHEDAPEQVMQAEADADADLEAQNAQLQEALVIMQEREAEYQAKLEEANNLLLNPEPAVAYGGEYEEEAEYEEEEYEEEEDDDDEDEEDEEEEEDDD